MGHLPTRPWVDRAPAESQTLVFVRACGWRAPRSSGAEWLVTHPVSRAAIRVARVVRALWVRVGLSGSRRWGGERHHAMLRRGGADP